MASSGATNFNTKSLIIREVIAVNQDDTPVPTDKVLVTSTNGIMIYQPYVNSGAWYLTPAGGPVDMNGNPIVNLDSIETSAGELTIGQPSSTPVLQVDGPLGLGQLYDTVYNPLPESFIETQLLTSGSSYTLSGTATLYRVEYTVVGAGGGGGASGKNGGGGGGGGGGSITTGNITVKPGTVITYSLGIGGTGGYNDGTVATDGIDGGTTSCIIVGFTVTSAGGIGGKAGNGGIFTLGGGNGGDGGDGAYGGGGGGGNAGSTYGSGGAGGVGTLVSGDPGTSASVGSEGSGGAGGGAYPSNGSGVTFDGGGGGGGGGLFGGKGGQDSVGSNGGLGSGGGGCSDTYITGGRGGDGYITLFITKFM